VFALVLLPLDDLTILTYAREKLPINFSRISNPTSFNNSKRHPHAYAFYLQCKYMGMCDL